MTVSLIYSPQFANHQTGEISFRDNYLIHHIAGQELIDPVYTVAALKYPYPLPPLVASPEQPARVLSCYDSLLAYNLIGNQPQQMKLFAPRPATSDELTSVHTRQYIERVAALSRFGGELGESVYMGAGSFEWAALSAGAGLSALEAIQTGQTESAFVLTRPPGHHAGPERAAGFCIFNNVAILARQCQRIGWRRVLIVDWDLHHGDGTQEIFYQDDLVLFCSIHQFGPELYPETGAHTEQGSGKGQGYTINLPLPAKTGDEDYIELFERVIPTLAESFRPDIILVSAGYDAHFNDTQNPYVYDPGGGFCLTAQTYHSLTRIIADCAAHYCQDRYIVILEGGYNLHNLTSGVLNTTAAMLGLPTLITETRPPNLSITRLT